VESTIFIRNELGLHARPAARLAQAAQQFDAEITLEYEGMTVDAKSILDILSLAAGQGASLTLRCQGKDAARAAEAIKEQFE
jgi:phosphocarrier protein